MTQAVRELSGSDGTVFSTGLDMNKRQLHPCIYEQET